MRQLGKQNGAVLVGALITIMSFLVLAMAVSEFGLSHFIGTKRTHTGLRAMSVAEAGAERFMAQFNADQDYATGKKCPSVTTETIFDFTAQGKPHLGKGVAKFCWNDSPSGFNNEKIVESTGEIYLPAGAAKPTLSRKIRLVIRGTAPFNYGLQTGNGPLYIRGNATFVGEVHANEFMYIHDNAVSVSGTFTIAGKNENAGGGKNNCSAYGNNNHMLASNFTAAWELVTHCGLSYIPPVPAPNENTAVGIQQLPSINKVAETFGLVGTPCAVLSNIATTSIGQQRFPNTGECNASTRPNATLVVTGNVHVKGNLTLDRNTLVASPSLTRNAYVIVESTANPSVDGRITFEGNGTTVVPNAAGYTVIFVSYNQSTACVQDPTDAQLNYCHSATDDKHAITIKGNGLSLFTNFLAPDGSINYQGRGSVGSMAGQAIVVKGNGLTVFLELNPVAQDPTVWNVTYYQQIFK